MGPGSSVGFALPADAPVASLLPALVESCGGQAAPGADRWELCLADGRTVAGDGTLVGSGVVEGAVLMLRQRPPASAGAEPAAAPASTDLGAARDAVSPLVRARLLLPARLGWSGRAGEALNAALFGLPKHRPATQGLDAASLTHRRTAGPLKRARLAWRAADYDHRLDQAITGPRLRCSATIAVVSPTGGVGKTTISVLLGTVFAWLRRDRVVAVDANPDFGSLGRILVPDHRAFVDDLLPVLVRPGLTVTGLESYLGRAANGLLVLPTPTEPSRMARLDEAAYEQLISRLQALVGLLVLDCGSGLQGPASRAALAASSQVVLVTDAEPAAASRAAEAFRLLERGGRPVVLAVNKMPGAGSQLDVRKLAAHVAGAGAMVAVPWEPAAAGRLAEGDLTWEEAPASWRLAVRELAAILAAQWPELGLTI